MRDWLFFALFVSIVINFVQAMQIGDLLRRRTSDSQPKGYQPQRAPEGWRDKAGPKPPADL